MNHPKRAARVIRGVLLFLLLLLARPAGGAAQEVRAETNRGFDCYVHTAEARMDARTPFLFAEADAAMKDKLVRGRQIVTIPGNGVNPHRVAGGHVDDWIGSVCIPGASVDRVVRMLQDYDHRAMYFSEIMSVSRLLCRSGNSRFQFGMLLKEPSTIESEHDEVWERLDGQCWKCRSYSTKMKEIGKQHRYLLRLNSYWRFRETAEGVYVQRQDVSLGGEAGALARSLGAMIGFSPEKSLRKTLTIMRDTAHRKDLEFAVPPAGTPACGPALPKPVCGAVTMN